MAKKLVVIDGHAIANRAFYAMPLLTNAEGEYTNAVYGFAMMLMKIIKDLEPTHMAVAFDSSAPTFRHERFDQYKAQRKGMPDELRPQIQLIKDLVSAFGIVAYEQEGFEADDLIGTLATRASDGPDGLPVVIVTGDRDVLQLTSDKVSALITRKGVTDLDEYDRDVVRDKYGLDPEQLIDVKALMGDSSDNIPGVPGIGEKTALKIIQGFGDLETAIERVDEVTPTRARNALAKNVEQARESRLLVQIRRDVPLDMDIESLRVLGFDRQSITSLFRKMGFKSILRRIEELPEKRGGTRADGTAHPDAAAGGGRTDEIKASHMTPECSIADLEELRGVVSRIVSAGDPIAVDLLLNHTEPMQAELIGISLFSASLDRSLYVPVANAMDRSNDVQSRCRAVLGILRPLLEGEAIRKHMNQAKQQIAFLLRHGISFKGLWFDTAIAAYLLDPDSSSYSLADLLYRYTSDCFVPDSALFGKGSTTPEYHAIEEVPAEDVACRYARAIGELLTLAEALDCRMHEMGMDSLWRDMELPLVEVLARMEVSGVKVDTDRLNELSEAMGQQIGSLESEIYSLAGQRFNINSPKQLATVLFEDLGLPAVKKTKTGYSTNQEVLESLAPMHRICRAILDYRALVKLKGTYADALPALVNNETGRIHTSFNQTVTSTGRLSSTNPNLQNIPVRTETGKMLREVFVPGGDFDYILGADYSQIELRVLAHMSEDEALVNAFRHDEDIHAKTASEVFSIPIEWVTSEQRSQAKAVNFGIVYGISDYGLSKNLGIPVGEAKRYIEGYFRLYKGVKRFMDESVASAHQDGYVTTLFGRRRYLPELNSRNVARRKFAERTAMNTPIQGTAADIIKAAMVKVDREIRSRGLRSRMLLQVHDELVFEVVQDELEELTGLVRQAMESAANLKVPLKVDIHAGHNWLEVK